MLALWIAGTLAVVIPFWLAIVPPMTDVSQHVLVARILDKYGDSTYGFSKYFVVVWSVAPTELFYCILSALQARLGPYTDAKVYLSAFVVALSASTWVLARVQRVEAPLVASLALLPLGACWYVYMGFLPFVTTFPLFALTIAVWLSEPRHAMKIPLLWVLLLLLYGFHIVGAAAAAVVIGVSAMVSAIRSPRTLRPLLTATVAGIPLAGVATAYLIGTQRPMVSVEYGSIVGNLISAVNYTCSSLASSGRFLMLLWLVGIGAAALWQCWQRWLPAWLITSVLGLVGLSVLLPTSTGALWPAGPRLVPFALILLVTRLSYARHVWSVGVASLALVVGLSVANGLKARDLDREFHHFMSAAPLVAPGSRLLPILVDPFEGAKAVSPFWSLPSAYTVYRGGANPYVFAIPYIKTGASPLRYRRRNDFGYSYLYERTRPVEDYRGVADAYDYVLVWGVDPELDAILEQELTVLYRDDKLRLYTTPRSHRVSR